MKSGFWGLMTALCCISIVSAQPGQFPAELEWEVQIFNRGITNQLGTIWVENDSIKALVAADSGVGIISNGEIIWRKNRTDKVIAAARIDRGEGTELIVCSVKDKRTGIFHHYYGYAGRLLFRHRQINYGYSYRVTEPPQNHFEEQRGREYKDFEVKHIGLLPHSNDTVFVYCSTMYLTSISYSSHLSQHFEIGGKIKKITLSEMFKCDSLQTRSPVSVLKYNSIEDEIERNVFVGNLISIQSESDVYDSVWNQGGFVKWDEQGFEEVEMYQYDALLEDPIGLIFSGATVSYDGNTLLVLSMQDSLGASFQVYDAIDNSYLGRISADQLFNYFTFVRGNDNQLFIIGLTDMCNVYQYHVRNLNDVNDESIRQIYYDPFVNEQLIGASLDDFNNDGDLELFALFRRSLRLYSVAPLNIRNNHSSEVSKNYVMLQAFPNPFNNSTTINFSLPIPGTVQLELLDPLGRKVRDLLPMGWFSAGHSEVILNCADLPAGTYIVNLSSDNSAMQKKITLIK